VIYHHHCCSTGS